MSKHRSNNPILSRITPAASDYARHSISRACDKYGFTVDEFVGNAARFNGHDIAQAALRDARKFVLFDLRANLFYEEDSDWVLLIDEFDDRLNGFHVMKGQSITCRDLEELTGIGYTLWSQMLTNLRRSAKMN